jgi:hypothetical protein
VHRLALAAVDHQPMHLVPQQLVGDRVAAEQDRAELLADSVCHPFPQRSRDAGHALVGLDLDESGLDGQRAGLGLRQTFEVVAGAILRIDVYGPDQTLLPEPALGGQRAAQPAQADGGDPHGVAAVGELPAPGRAGAQQEHDEGGHRAQLDEAAVEAANAGARSVEARRVPDEGVERRNADVAAVEDAHDVSEHQDRYQLPSGLADRPRLDVLHCSLRRALLAYSVDSRPGLRRKRKEIEGR